tara:strand:+ start:2022 stop:2780 length:759 start_codon:yes stop_codon:yes gene_type:complete
MIEILILSLVQGVTEFLPVSSSSHLILIAKFMEFNEKSLSLDVSMHIGSFIAVLTFFNKEIFNFIENKELLIKIIISSLPIMIIGFLLVKTDLINEIRNLKVIGWTTLIFGILLYISDRFNFDKNIENNFSFKTALIIGLFQVFSLIPGVSRSGITITAARLLNFNRVDSAKISFLLSVPTLAAVSIFGVKNIVSSQSIVFSIQNITSIFLSFIFSFITIKYFLKYIKNFNLNLFVYYRILLGSFLIGIAYL